MARKPRSVKAPTTADPIEIAMTAEAKDNAPDSPARILLLEQVKLVRAQRQSEWFGAALKVLTGLAGLAAAFALGAMAWDASREDGLVIEAFSVPPELAARGLTGEVVAAKLLDELTALETATDSLRAPGTYANNWTGNISVEIPSTGVSVTELRRLLVDWLGNQTHVRGEVYSTSDGLVLTTRGAGAAADHAGSEADLDTMIHAAAEDIYGATQPYRYGIFLMNAYRFDEARSVLTRLAEDGAPDQRAWGLIGLERIEPDTQTRVDLLRRATELGPELALAWSNLANIQDQTGDPEAARQSINRGLGTLDRTGHGGIKATAIEQFRHDETGRVAASIGDFAKAQEETRLAYSLASGRRGRRNAQADLREFLARGHDIGAVRQMLPTGLDDAAISRAELLDGGFCCQTPNAWINVAIEDWQGVLDNLQGLEALLSEPAVLQRLRNGGNLAPTLNWPTQARALAHLGRLDEARALVERTPEDCYACLMARGEVAALAGDPAAADDWFGKAVAFAPSFPFAETEWGRVLLARGDTAGAIAKLTAAARKGPHYADALELWGEALMARRDFKGAVVKFAEADRYAPKWGRNHLRWGEALAGQGKTAEAQAQWRIAAGLEMSVADRARLVQLQGQ